MKQRRLTLVFTLLLKAGVAQADTVLGDAPDTLPAGSFGGLSGFMAGAAAGGPIGAAIGAGFGWLVGAETARSTGLGSPAYRVRLENGEETVVRSPGRSWSPGDRVKVVGGRLVAAEESVAPARTLSALAP